MPRKPASAFVSAFALAIFCLVARLPAHATEMVAPGESDAVEAEVRGLSPDDLLNVRATASPTGLVLARIPNGSLLRRLDCADFRGYEWCRVEIDYPEHLVGWTPSRYLRVGAAPGSDEDDAGVKPPPVEKFDRSQIVAGILPDPLPSLGLEADETSGQDEIRTVLLSPSPGSGSDPMLAFDEERESRKIDAAAPAFALAMAARNAPFAAEVFTPEGGSATPPEAADGTDGTLSLVPIPTPRPLRYGEEPVAETPAPETPEIPVQDLAEFALKEAAELPTQEAMDVYEREVAGAPASGIADAAAPEVAQVPAPAAAESSAEEAVDVPVREMAALEPIEAPRGLVDAALSVLFPKERQSPPAAVAEEAAPRGAGAGIAAADGAGVPATEASGNAAEPPAADEPDPIIVAQTAVAMPQQAQDASTEIPCARYVGQPMTRCEARIARSQNGDAEVTVLWPDGGSRVIRFRSGKPDGSNTLQEFRFTREADLNMIRIGVGERFEILDALPLGR